MFHNSHINSVDFISSVDFIKIVITLWRAPSFRMLPEQFTCNEPQLTGPLKLYSVRAQIRHGSPRVRTQLRFKEV